MYPIQSKLQSCKSAPVKRWGKSGPAYAENTQWLPITVSVKNKFHSRTSKALSYQLLPDPHHFSQPTSWYSLPCSLSSSHAGVFLTVPWVCQAYSCPAIPLPGMLLPQTATGLVLSLPSCPYSKVMFSVSPSLEPIYPISASHLEFQFSIPCFIFPFLTLITLTILYISLIVLCLLSVSHAKMKAPPGHDCFTYFVHYRITSTWAWRLPGEGLPKVSTGGMKIKQMN